MNSRSIPQPIQRIAHRVAIGAAALILPTWMAAQTVNIPDANLEAAIRRTLNKPTGEITKADMESMTTLIADDKQIVDITGLEHAVNLEVLNLVSLCGGNYPCGDENAIADISPLSGLTKLQQLGIAGNPITDFSVLANLTNLQKLWLAEAPITNLDFLAGLTKLDLLFMWSNTQLADISAIANLTELKELHIESSGITDISALGGLTKLEELYLYENQISDLSPLASLSELTVLSIYDNQVRDITPLTGLSKLSAVQLQRNYLDISEGSETRDIISQNFPRAFYLPQNVPPENRTGERLVNLSTRGWVGTGDAVLIDGFVVNGERDVQVLIRGIGPSLAQFGITTYIAAPIIRVHRIADDGTSELVGESTSRSGSAIGMATKMAGAFPLDPGSRDAALFMLSSPGSYTVTLSDLTGGEGLGMIEVYQVQ